MVDAVKSFLKRSPIALSKNHRYDLQTRKILTRVLSENSCCIDVGCHKGEILDLMLAAAPHGRHFGFEPIPSLFTDLEIKYKDQPSCEILNIAASNVTGTSTFNFVTSNPSYSGLVKRKYDRKDEVDEQITVATDLIDNSIPAGVHIDLIKIDVEGAELLVLEGAEMVIETSHPVVIFEHGLGAADVYGATPQKVFDFFAKHEMQISTLTNYLKQGSSFTLEEFQNQYEGGINYYFVAHLPH